MTRLCLIRHGETDWNLQGLTQGSRDIPLNELGRRQAQAAAACLAREEWDVIYSSPLSRARETAEIIAEASELPPILDDQRLVERDFGPAEGMDVYERRARFHHAEIPGAESWELVHERARSVALDMVRSNSGRRILAVAHGGLIGALLSVVSGGSLRPGRPPLANCSMSMLEYDGRTEDWEIAWYNRTAPDCSLEPAVEVR